MLSQQSKALAKPSHKAIIHPSPAAYQRAVEPILHACPLYLPKHWLPATLPDFLRLHLVWVLGCVGCDLLPYGDVLRDGCFPDWRMKDGGFVHVLHINGHCCCRRLKVHHKGGLVGDSHLQHKLLLHFKVQTLNGEAERRGGRASGAWNVP